MSREWEVGDVYGVLVKGWRKVGKVTIATKIKLGDKYIYDYGIYLHTHYARPDEGGEDQERYYGSTHDPEFWLLERAYTEIRIDKNMMLNPCKSINVKYDDSKTSLEC